MAVFSDTFTAADNTTIESRNADTGEAWTRIAGNASQVISANCARGPSTAVITAYKSAWVPTSADYTVTGSLVQKTSAAGMMFGGRIQANGDGYYFQRDPINSKLNVFLCNGNLAALTNIGSLAWTQGSPTRVVRVTFAGSTITVDDVTSGTVNIGTVTDGTITNKGSVGTYHTASSSSATTRIHLADLAADDGSGAPAAPTNTVTPTITTDGTPQSGETVTCSTGTWTGSPTFAYQWKRAGVAISGATSSAYTLQGADVSVSVKCTVTGTNLGGSASVDSNTITPAAAPTTPVNSAAPAITDDGTPQTGDVVTVSTGTWSGSPTSYAYQWKRNGANISGATVSSYTLQGADEGTALKCTVSATNGAGTTAADSNTISPLASGFTRDFIYSSATSGLVGSLALEIVNVGTSAVTAARTTSNIVELVPGSGLYRARRAELPAGHYVLLWDEGTQAPGLIVFDEVTY